MSCIVLKNSYCAKKFEIISAHGNTCAMLIRKVSSSIFLLFGETIKEKFVQKNFDAIIDSEDRRCSGMVVQLQISIIIDIHGIKGNITKNMPQQPL